MLKNQYLGIELGSTRIKAVAIDEAFQVVSTGGYTWQSQFAGGIWTYELDEAIAGVKKALAQVENRDCIKAVGISGMMHGYLAFDKDWNLLTPFRTWQNTITAEAAEILTERFAFNVPQRWSVAHLYQAVLNDEAHIADVAHITTLAGYVHYLLTGVNAIGVGEASGMFPIDSEKLCYDEKMIAQFDALIAQKNLPWKILDVLPAVKTAGEQAGELTQVGANLLDNLLPAGIPFAPPEGDAGTGMIATNAVAPRTGNVSAGTSIFAMVVLEKALKKVYPEIDIVTTPSGKPVAMVHCNNCTSDSNQWISLLRETLQLFGTQVSDGELYTKLYEASLAGEADCGGVLVCNYMAGEGITHLDAGVPLVARKSGSHFTLANFMRSTLYSTMATLKLGMDILAEEDVAIDSLTGHGGLFKTPGVAQRYMAAACNAEVTCMETAGEGGPFGMALLAAFLFADGESLEDFLNNRVFCNASAATLAPQKEDVDGFAAFMDSYKALIKVEEKAVDCL